LNKIINEDLSNLNFEDMVSKAIEHFSNPLEVATILHTNPKQDVNLRALKT